MGSLKDTSMTLPGCRSGTSNCLVSLPPPPSERPLEACDVCVCSTCNHDGMDDSTRPGRLTRPLVVGFSSVPNSALLSVWLSFRADFCLVYLHDRVIFFW